MSMHAERSGDSPNYRSPSARPSSAQSLRRNDELSLFEPTVPARPSPAQSLRRNDELSLFEPTVPARRPSEHTKPREASHKSLTGQLGQVAEQESEGFVAGTFKAFGGWLVMRFADAHGLGVALKTIELCFKAVQWLRGDGLDVSVPVPVGSGVDLQLSAHLTDGPDAKEPPLTLCFSPSGYSPIGVLKIDEFEIDPSSKSTPATSGPRHLPHMQHAASDPLLAQPGDVGLDHRPTSDTTGPDSLSLVIPDTGER